MNHEDLEIMLDKELEELILLEAVENKVDDELNNETSLNKEADEETETKKKKRKKFSSKKLKSILNVRTLLILLLTLIVNTYAWFIYLSSASLGLDVHVRSWKFDFSFEDDSVEDGVFLIAEDIYPGMAPVEKSITAENKGETTANLSYKVSYIRVFDDILLDGSRQITSEEFERDYMSRYPFKISLNMNVDSEESESDLEENPEELVLEGGQSARINFTVSWEYEQGTTDEEKENNNRKDTEIGIQAYNYYNTKVVNGVEEELTEDEKNERMQKAIEIKVIIEAVQVEESSETGEEITE